MDSPCRHRQFVCRKRTRLTGTPRFLRICHRRRNEGPALVAVQSGSHTRKTSKRTPQACAIETHRTPARVAFWNRVSLGKSAIPSMTALKRNSAFRERNRTFARFLARMRVTGETAPALHFSWPCDTQLSLSSVLARPAHCQYQLRPPTSNMARTTRSRPRCTCVWERVRSDASWSVRAVRTRLPFRFPARFERRAPADRRGPRVRAGRQARRDCQDRRGPLVRQEWPDRPVHRDRRAHRDPRARRDRRG